MTFHSTWYIPVVSTKTNLMEKKLMNLLMDLLSDITNVDLTSALEKVRTRRNPYKTNHRKRNEGHATGA